MNGIVTKICRKCGNRKFLDQFPKDKKQKDGLRSECKDCKKLYMLDYYSKNINKWKENNKNYYESHKETIIERAKKWYNKPENKKRHRELCKRRAEESPEQYKAYRKTSSKRRANKIREYKKDWCKKNPYKGRQYNQSRRAKVLEVGGKITAKEWEALLDYYGHKCLCCERTEEEVPIHLDHIVPISKGGKNIIQNAQPLCKSCNSAKHDDIIDYRICHQ